MSEQAHGVHKTGHHHQSARRFTIGLLTTGNFIRFAPGHWLGLIDAAREQDVNVMCFLGEPIHAPKGFKDPVFAAPEVGKALRLPDSVRGPAGAVFDLVDIEAINGLIIWTSALNWFVSQAEMANFCLRYHLPVVSVEVPFPDIPSILIDDYGGMYSAVSHLIEAHSYRHIAFVGGFKNHVGMHERYRGYVAALADHGLALDPNLVTTPGSSDGRIDIKELLDERGLRPGIEFDAVVGWSGGTVAEIHALFEERGIKVPGDVAVVGFDNPVELGMYLPPYTMVDPQVYQASQRAAELMLGLLRGDNVPAQSTVPARLIVRRSCGCPDRAVIAAGAESSSTSRVVLPGAHSARETLADLLATQREKLLAGIIDAAPIARDQATDFLTAFSASLQATAPEIFLSRLESLLQQTITAGANPTVWHSALSALRRTLPVFDDIRLLSQIEDLWQQARVLIGETARRRQAHQALLHQQRLQMLREVQAALLNTYNMSELAEVLARSLPILGIPSAYLALYEHPQAHDQGWLPPEWSRLILACDGRGWTYFDVEGQRFRSRELAPGGMLPSERQCSFVIEALYLHEHPLGFVLFEIGPREAVIYETLREGISNALYGNWLLREREQAQETLRRQAIELEFHQREQRRRVMLEHVVQAGKVMTQAADLRTCLLNIRNSIQRELDFDRVGVFLYDAERNAITGSYGTDSAGQLTEEWDSVIPIPADAPYRSLLSQLDGFLFTSDYDATYNPPPGTIMVGVKHHAMVGVWADDQPIALVTVDNLLTQRAMMEEQLEALRLVASYAGLAIKNARLLDQVRQAEQKYRSIFVNSLEGIAQITPEGEFLSANPAMARILGYASPAELITGVTDFQNEILVDSVRREELKQLLKQQDEVRDFEAQIRRKDGHLAWVSLNVQLVRTGQSTYVEGTWQDITERRQLEAQLLKSQKMEAIGQLAGGIAHDFNNLLIVISGSADLVSGALNPNDPIQADMHEIQRATERAANLTRQLLTFARRQVSSFQILNLNELILELEKLLRRLIREDILLQISSVPNLWLVQADPGQIEQVIINLAVNARDAMPQGGRLTIETANIVLDEEYARMHPSVAPGPYVLLAVSDTGTGMSGDVLQHAFEPFFTTKELGQGSGLGLATCYGIVSQHGGSIQIYSEIERGTSVKVYLPRAQGDTIGALSSHEAHYFPHGTETILLVEDETAVRALTARVLRHQGYTVLEAANGIEALDLIGQGKGIVIDLLLTDMIMPGMGGYELAENTQQRIPGIRVLFMSGYTDNTLMQNELLDSNISFLQKPFTSSVLACSVRAVLDH